MAGRPRKILIREIIRHRGHIAHLLRSGRSTAPHILLRLRDIRSGRNIRLSRNIRRSRRRQCIRSARGPVTVPQGTLLQLRTSEAVASKRATDGDPVQFTVIQDVTLGGVLAIPKGATVHGVVSR